MARLSRKEGRSSRWRRATEGPCGAGAEGARREGKVATASGRSTRRRRKKDNEAGKSLHLRCQLPQRLWIKQLTSDSTIPLGDLFWYGLLACAVWLFFSVLFRKPF